MTKCEHNWKSISLSSHYPFTIFGVYVMLNIHQVFEAHGSQNKGYSYVKKEQKKLVREIIGEVENIS